MLLWNTFPRFKFDKKKRGQNGMEWFNGKETELISKMIKKSYEFNLNGLWYYGLFLGGVRA